MPSAAAPDPDAPAVAPRAADPRPARAASARIDRAGTARRVGRALLGLAVATALAATFALYLRPGLSLDIGQLMAFCGLR
jgi:hypothetical protein